jgi:hypothetical protein
MVWQGIVPLPYLGDISKALSKFKKRLSVEAAITANNNLFTSSRKVFLPYHVSVWLEWHRRINGVEDRESL